MNARTRCAILLSADTGKNHGNTYKEIASMAGCTETTVISTLRSFLVSGFTATVTPKRGAGSDTARLKMTGDVEAKLIALACSPAPKGYVRWTLNLLYNQMMVVLEDRISISRATIGRALMKNELRPHLSEYWCIPPKDDAEFVAAMEDILDVYEQPYDPKRPLWCMDEKPYQILDESRTPLPMRPEDIRKIDSEYVRNGTVSIFCFIQPHTGRILHSVEPTRTAVDWAEKIKYLADEVEPEAEKIVLAKATEAAGLTMCHAGVRNLVQSKKYLGDGFYPQIIEKEIFDKVEKERTSRELATGKVGKNRRTSTARNILFSRREDFAELMKKSAEEAISADAEKRIREIDEECKALQIKLMSLPKESEETDRIGSQICRMVEEKNEILSEKIKDESKQQRMESMMKLLEDEPDGFNEYDDSLVRSFVERITVMDCTLVVKFKSGIEIEVAA